MSAMSLQGGGAGGAEQWDDEDGHLTVMFE